MFWRNVKRRIEAIGIQLKHAEESGISNSIKSSYYRSAIILSCTVLEGMVYDLVKYSSRRNGNIIGIITEHKERHKISSKVFTTSNDFFICEKIKKDLHIDDNGVDFGKLNIYLKNSKIVSDSEYKRLDWVRKERNKIHIQGLVSHDTGYTRQKVNKIGAVILLVIDKLEKSS